MKKITSILLAMAFGIGLNTAHAEAVAVGTPITSEECDTLGEDVSPSLSKNVGAAYACDAANNLIVVGACHENGRKKVETIQCVQIGEWGGEVKWNDESCGSAADDFPTEVTGKGFVATNAGGSAGAVTLGGACNIDGSTMDSIVGAL